MKNLLTHRLLAFVLLLSLGCWNASAEEPSKANASVESKQVWTALPSGVEINLKTKTLRFPVEVVNDRGGLEFLISIGKDKDYESLFSCSCRGQDLHMALLMIGATANGNLEMSPPKDSLLSIQVEFDQKILPIESWVKWSDGRGVEDLGLYFKGSTFQKMNDKTIYSADVTLNILAAWEADEMVMGPSVKIGNPYDEGSDEPFLKPVEPLLYPLGSHGMVLIQLKP